MSLNEEVESEIRNFESELARFERGELGPERFRAFRLAFGVYGQRQPGVQMVRVKIPAGIATGGQLAAMADIAEEFAGGVAHLTTRQDVQLYHVPLARVPGLFRALARAGFTTREACGNSVRNVTACPLAGVAADELFDVRPYALGTAAFLLRHPGTQQLARKFKAAFSACPEDCAATAIHDIGAVGRVVTEGGRTRYGFRIVVGGGLGSAPFVAESLSEFVPVEDLLGVVKAVVAASALHANRRNKARARLKFVVHREGIAWLRRRVAEIVEGSTPEERAEAEISRYLPPDLRAVHAGYAAGRPAAAVAGVLPVRVAGVPEEWLGRNVRPHRDPARAVVTVKLPLGDVPSAGLRRLGELTRRFSRDEARISIGQALVLPQVERADLARLHAELAALGGAAPVVGTALDVTSCPGAASCNLAITASKGLAGALAEAFAAEDPRDLAGVSVKVSGCPNSCGQHHVADIGFHGVVKRVGSRQVPAYQLHLGGRAGREGGRIGRAGLKLPARNAPAAAREVLALYRRERKAGEPLAGFLDRFPAEKVDAALAPFARVREEDAATFVDWGAAEPFEAHVAAGDCAGAGTDAASDRLAPAEEELRQAGRFIANRQWADAAANLGRLRFTLARALLEVLGKKPETDYETLWEYRTEVIDRGHAGEGWNDFHARAERLLALREPDPAAVERLHGDASALLAESRGTERVLAGLARRPAADVAG